MNKRLIAVLAGVALLLLASCRKASNDAARELVCGSGGLRAERCRERPESRYPQRHRTGPGLHILGHAGRGGQDRRRRPVRRPMGFARQVPGHERRPERAHCGAGKDHAFARAAGVEGVQSARPRLGQHGADLEGHRRRRPSRQIHLRHDQPDFQQHRADRHHRPCRRAGEESRRAHRGRPEEPAPCRFLQRPEAHVRLFGMAGGGLRTRPVESGRHHQLRVGAAVAQRQRQAGGAAHAGVSEGRHHHRRLSPDAVERRQAGRLRQAGGLSAEHRLSDQDVRANACAGR